MRSKPEFAFRLQDWLLEDEGAYRCFHCRELVVPLADEWERLIWAVNFYRRSTARDEAHRAEAFKEYDLPLDVLLCPRCAKRFDCVGDKRLLVSRPGGPPLVPVDLSNGYHPRDWPVGDHYLCFHCGSTVTEGRRVSTCRLVVQNWVEGAPPPWLGLCSACQKRHQGRVKAWEIPVLSEEELEE